jgi:glutathione synthase
MADMKAFLAEHDHVVAKPLDGMGGKSIFVVRNGDKNANVIFETLTDYGRQFAMVQVFVPEISAGDKRILLINGVAVPYALARVPSDDDHRGNLVTGATGIGQELSAADRAICEQVGPVLRDAGVLFAGIDIIGDLLTEVNVTSPTGIRELDTQFDLNIAGLLFDAIESET